MKDKPGLGGIAILSALFFLVLSINSPAAQGFIIENKASALLIASGTAGEMPKRDY